MEARLTHIDTPPAFLERDELESWLHGQPVFSRFCAERNLHPDDVDSLDAFLCAWEPDWPMDGICRECGHSTEGRYLMDTDSGQRSFHGTTCCRANLVEVFKNELREIDAMS